MKATHTHNKVYMPKSRERILQDLGFDPPTQAFTRIDARGEEYGCIEVVIEKYEIESTRVTHSEQGWTAHFKTTQNLIAFLQSL